MSAALPDDYWDDLAAEYAEDVARAQQPIAMPADVWDESPILAAIRQVAFGRLRSPDAVLGTVLALRAVQIDPTYQIPPIAGGNGSLNMVVGYVSNAGGGKSTTYAIGRDLIPLAHQRRTKSDAPIGSGEGLGELFYDNLEVETANGKATTERRCGPTNGGTNAVGMFVDEGQSIQALTQRNGSTTASALRKAWSGSTLGESNASDKAHRAVPAQSYRFAMVAAFQYPNAAAVIADSETGTAQRFLWVGTQHPDIDADHPAMRSIDPLGLSQPPIVGGGVVQLLEYPSVVATEIREAEAAEMNGSVQVNLLDTHRRMMKLKVSALLQSLLTPDNVRDVTLEAWELAEVVVATSDRHRDVVQGYAVEIAKELGRVENAKAAGKHVATLEAADAFKVTKVVEAATWVQRRVKAKGPQTKRELQRSITNALRDYLEDGVQHGAEAGMFERDGEWDDGTLLVRPL